MSLKRFFEGQEHQPFRWENGKPAALLIHGFMGTPDEMRPLAEAMHQAGWTVEGLLLPGFGAQLDSLFERTEKDWSDAVQHALAALRKDHHPVVIVGYSLGASIAIQASAQLDTDGLLLLAPFWSLDGGWMQRLWPALRIVFRQIQPFRQMDFTNPRIRDEMTKMLGEVDLDDPDLQQTLRELIVPSAFVDELRGLGRGANRLAESVAVPTLILQGIQDQVVNPRFSRHLASRISGPIHYLELPADHQLLDPESDTWGRVVHWVLEFAGQLLPSAV